MQSCSCLVKLCGLPRFVKTCPRCKNPYYENSGCFRVNANGKLLDIWLIARCERCKNAWNLSIYERISRDALDANAYAGYLANDCALMNKHVFDPAFLQKNRAVLDLDHLDISILGELPSEGTAASVCFACAFPLPLPAGRVIALALHISLSSVKRMQENGHLVFENDLRKTKAGTACSFSLAEGWKQSACR